MIRILGCLFWNIVRTRLAGPEKANRPILVLVDGATPPDFVKINGVPHEIVGHKVIQEIDSGGERVQGKWIRMRPVQLIEVVERAK